MDDIALNTLPHFIKILRERLYSTSSEEGGLATELSSLIHSIDKSPLIDVRISNTSAGGALEPADKELRIMELACSFALRTVTSYAGKLLAHRDLFIERSKPRLLDIVLPDYGLVNSVDDDDDGEKHITPQLALEPFIPHLERWGKLSLIYIELEALNLPLAPNLHSVYVYHSPYNPSVPLPTHALFPQRPPSLCRLSLIGNFLPITSPMFSDLEELYLRDTSHHSADFLGMLAACPRLRRFKMGSGFVGPFNQVARSNFEPIALPHLDTMELHWMRDDTVRGILSSIIVPPTLALGSKAREILGRFLPPAAIIERCLPNLLSVRTLRLETKMDKWEVWLTKKSSEGGLLEAISPFGNSSLLPETLEKMASEFRQHMPGLLLHILSFLRIHDCHLNSLAFTQLVTDLPTLAVLSLDKCNAPSFLEALIFTPTTQLCPSHQSLRLHGSCVHKDTLIEVANSRRDQLLHIDITRCDGIDAEIVSELRWVLVERAGASNSVAAGNAQY
ncbi:hypothetical protein BOTBODRAFT_645942 [Botryobasidium botryosum FD-172 SS1]|uniref:F-box domain-containing protein n=1 Tax=Botryobasidium botryosum (strain FD-172 SS1) TaxID=930990 RepID=A0A067M9R9_BOTB1|nr:hypothetical protein BOTBODRAFT_645942 [Botryobasidium botryosum FD-172 SS1]